MQRLFLLTMVMAMSLVLQAQKMYWVDAFLDRSWSTGTDFSTITEISPDVSYLGDMAIDPIGKHIYYSVAKDDSGFGTSAIIRTKLDGTEKTNIVLEAGAGRAKQLALDLQHQMIYWTAGEYPDVSIRRSGLDGSNPTVIVDLTGSNTPLTIAVDAANSKLYWTVSASSFIFTSDLNGTNLDMFTSDTNGEGDVEDIAVSPESGKIYWVKSPSSNSPNQIIKANLDGTNQEVLSDLGYLDDMQGIELDWLNQKLYWSRDNEVIYRSNLDGTGAEQYLRPEDYLNSSLVGKISDIAFDYGPTNSVLDISNEVGFNVSPNPSNGTSINLDFDKTGMNISGEMQVQIFDATGKLTSLGNYSPAKTLSLNLNLSPGLYLVRCIQGSKNFGGQRLLVLR